MLTYSDHFRTISAENSFFAGANTPLGFYGEYCNLLSEDELDKIYMIKGASGTGKSTLIRRCARVGEALSAKVTYLLCSSDPESLDGVIIEKGERRIAVTDATAPHTQDPMYAGACGEIVNCGDFWDPMVLEEKKGAISQLVKEKGAMYKRAYRYLAAAKEIFDIQQSLAEGYVQRDKMEKAILRLCGELVRKNSGSGKVSYRRTLAVSMKGAVRLSSFERAENLYGVSDGVLLSPVFYETLLSLLRMRGVDVTVSQSPVFGVAELYVPSLDCAFVPYSDGVKYKKVINLRRFADKEGLGAVKQKRIFTSKCLAAVMEGAEESLREAGDRHFSLEEVYKSAMDFEGLSLMADELCESIAKRLS